MQNDAENNRYELIQQDAKAYFVVDILRFMSEAEYLFQFHNRTKIIPPNYFGKWEDDVEGPLVVLESKSSKDTHLDPEHLKHFLSTHKSYLIERLLKAVVEKEFELLDWEKGKILDPPVSGDSESSAQVKMGYFNQSSGNTSWDFSPEGLSSAEPDFIRALANPQSRQQTVIPNFRPIYKTLLGWVTMASITRKGLIRFCELENIRIKFEAEQAGDTEDSTSVAQAKNSYLDDGLVLPLFSHSEPVEQRPVLDMQEEGRLDSSIERWRLANYIQLADAFKVLNNLQANKAWFKNRCSDYKKYAIFNDAIRQKGSQGAGNVSLFDVITIASHFESNSALKSKRRKGSDYFNPANYKQYLRTRIEAHFPQLLEEFDDRFGTKDSD